MFKQHVRGIISVAIRFNYFNERFQNGPSKNIFKKSVSAWASKIALTNVFLSISSWKNLPLFTGYNNSGENWNYWYCDIFSALLGRFSETKRTGKLGNINHGIVKLATFVTCSRMCQSCRHSFPACGLVPLFIWQMKTSLVGINAYQKGGYQRILTLGRESLLTHGVQTCQTQREESCKQFSS